MEIISFKNVSFAYSINDFNTLNNVSFSVNKGEICLFIGKSAAGKSTILKLMKKEIAPFGTLVGDVKVGASVGYVSQNVNENIVCDKVRSELSFGLTNMGLSREIIDLKVAEIASYFNLSSKLDCDISSLSGGEKQILNLASIMIMNPEILVLDEPTCQLDPVAASRFIETVKKLNSDFGTTIIIAEHLLENLYIYANKVVLVDEGSTPFEGTPLEMVSYLKKEGSPMLKSVPIAYRLFENASSVSECREILEKMQKQTVLHSQEIAKPILKAKGIYFAYEKNNDILTNLSFDAFPNKINAILGANSSGKTTLLKVLSGVYKQHHGKIKCNQKIAMLCQNPFDLFTKEKCSDEVEFGETTRLLQIDEIANQHPFDISAGQAQRLALAKVLEAGADIILLDEPTKALDSDFKQRLGELLCTLCKQGKTIVLVSHDTDFVASFGDVVSFLSNGEIIATMPRQQMFSSLGFYTSSVGRITKGICDEAVSEQDLANMGVCDEKIS